MDNLDDFKNLMNTYPQSEVIGDSGGKTLLHLAVQSDNSSAVQLLLDKNANPKATDPQSKSNIHFHRLNTLVLMIFGIQKTHHFI